MSEGRGPWYLLTGLVLGIAIGLAIAWWLAPVEYVNTTPDTLRADFKDEYRYMVGLSYGATGNLARARARLSTLGDLDPAASLGEQAQRMLASNVSMEAVQVLANLSEALRAQLTPSDVQAGSSTSTGVSAVPAMTVLPTSTLDTGSPLVFETSTPVGSVATAATENTSFNGSPQPSQTATEIPPTQIATATPRPTRTVTPTPGQPFALVGQATFCEAAQPGLLQVYLQNSNGDPAPGMEITITWAGGEETFFSGLKPELGAGYADFVMSAGVEYVLSLSNGLARLPGIKAPPCSVNGADFPGGIRLDFRQP